ncbi:MAG TPA: ABC transporter substrate-binding protein [Streptosporangiaceae bacterium]|nr:ABC transporter substrate-binding protein [Streptosporangiaceae bacterium]
MKPVPKRLAALAVVAVAATGLAACGKSSGGSTGSSSTNKPAYGGTLNVVAASGQDHIDPVSAYGTWDYMMERAYTRQLVNYPAANYSALGDAGWKKDVTPVADVATSVPTQANGGITDGGKTYTFHIKPGVDWNNGRQVTSQDFLRQYKAFGNPVSPVGNSGYFLSTIAGFKQYFDAETAYFAKKSHKPTAANIASYQNSHSISGITTPNSSTIQFHLTEPAGDFLFILAMPFNSARPAEYDKYVPDSAQMRAHIMSDGPYNITSYTPGKQEVLTRNTAWKQSTDPLRHQYVNKVVVTMGQSNATTQVDELKAGTSDLMMDTPFPPQLIQQMQATHNPDFKLWPWSNTNPYIVFNLQSPDAGGAMKNVKVRQAMEFTVNKAAIQKLFGGPAVAKVINTAIPPGNAGYQPISLYNTPNNQGDPAKCKSMLAAAGFKGGLTLTDLYLNDSVNTALFQSVQASFANCGIKLKGKPEPISSYFVDLGNAPQNNKPNAWDVAQPAWIPDWFGDNGRTTVQPFFQTDCALNTINYGCFSNKTVDADITRALKAPSESAAAPLWHQVDLIAQQQAVMVPLIDQYNPVFSSDRVASPGSPTVLFTANIGDPDITNIFIKKADQ